jgi:hypothetical protein
MDFIVQLPVTKHYKDAILVFIDRLSKMVHFAATHTTVTAKDTARLFRHEVFRLHGMPREIILDRDTRFTSNSWKEVCRLLDIRQGLSTAYHPQTDGQTQKGQTEFWRTCFGIMSTQCWMIGTSIWMPSNLL